MAFNKLAFCIVEYRYVIKIKNHNTFILVYRILLYFSLITLATLFGLFRLSSGYITHLVDNFFTSIMEMTPYNGLIEVVLQMLN